MLLFPGQPRLHLGDSVQSPSPAQHHTGEHGEPQMAGACVAQTHPSALSCRVMVCGPGSFKVTEALGLFVTASVLF